MTNNTTHVDENTYGIEDISDAEIYFNAVFLAVVMAITIVGNALALHAFFISPELRQITYYFIASLCISDLMVAVFSISLWIIDLLNRWGPNEFSSHGLPMEFKTLYQSVDIFGGTWSIMSLAFISIERYICITHSLHYPYIMTLKRVYTFFAILLVYCSIVTVLNQRYIDEDGSGHVIRQFCIVFMAYVLPVFIKVFTYSKIYLEAKKQSRQISMLRKYTYSLNNNSPDSNSEAKLSLTVESATSSDSPLSEERISLKGTENDNEAKLTTSSKFAHVLARGCCCIQSVRINETESTECLQYARDSSTSNGAMKTIQTTSTIFDSIADKQRDTSDKQNIETEFINDEVCENPFESSCASCILTNERSLNVPCDEDLICQTFSHHDSREVRRNLNPLSAIEDVKDKQTNSEGCDTPLRIRLRTITKWSPAASPLIVRRFNKKSSEQKRNEQKIRRFKKELRAAKVVALIMGTFLICWTPFNVLMLLFAIHVDTVMRYVMLAKLLHYMNSAINPILYVVLNKVYRTAVVKVIKKFRLSSNCY